MEKFVENESTNENIGGKIRRKEERDNGEVWKTEEGGELFRIDGVIIITAGCSSGVGNDFNKFGAG